MPPPEEEPVPNKPPTLEWKLTEPQGSWVIFDSRVDSSVTFSIANAVRDAEGDEVYYLWYWRIPGGAPVPEGWPEPTLTLLPCERNSLRSAKEVQVTVVFSDRYISYDRYEDQFPVAYDEEFPPLVREWTVELLGACVD
jgi:hypothetical protein